MSIASCTRDRSIWVWFENASGLAPRIFTFEIGHWVFGFRRQRSTKTDFNQPLGDIPHLTHPFSSAGSVECIVGEQTVVVLEVRAAATGVADDRVDDKRIDRVDMDARQAAGGFEVAVVLVERAAAMLVARGEDFAAVFHEHVSRGAVDLGEDQV